MNEQEIQEAAKTGLKEAEQSGIGSFISIIIITTIIIGGGLYIIFFK